MSISRRCRLLLSCLQCALLFRKAMSSQRAAPFVMKMQHEFVPVMDYRLYRRARKLVHECCNYDHGNCLMLARGDGCICVQSISYSLLCKWFVLAVLPLDQEMHKTILFKRRSKRCVICGNGFIPGSNRAIYCPDCAVKTRRRKEAERQRNRYHFSTHLDKEKPL